MEWGISTEHFDPYARARGPRSSRTPLEEILVENSSYNRSSLKRRLFEEGLRERRCGLCGQAELWHGKRMGLILDHVNGVRDDNRLKNLRIVCPNCAATLATHCGRKNRAPIEPKACLRCRREFLPNYRKQRYCSAECGRRWDRTGHPLRAARKVDWPAREQLLEEVNELGYLATGRKYGVSDNAVRKRLTADERARAVREGRDPDVAEIPRRTWPNRRDRKAA